MDGRVQVRPARHAPGAWLPIHLHGSLGSPQGVTPSKGEPCTAKRFEPEPIATGLDEALRQAGGAERWCLLAGGRAGTQHEQHGAQHLLQAPQPLEGSPCLCVVPCKALDQRPLRAQRRQHKRTCMRQRMRAATHILACAWARREACAHAHAMKAPPRQRQSCLERVPGLAAGGRQACGAAGAARTRHSPQWPPAPLPARCSRPARRGRAGWAAAHGRRAHWALAVRAAPCLPRASWLTE